MIHYNGVAWYFKEKGQQFVYRCINRLDRDTTGALILAKNPYSAAVLSAQMKQRQIRRTYLAIVQGIAPEQGTIDAPIGRAADSTIERQVDFANGESAVTHYERLATYHSYSLIELHLETDVGMIQNWTDQRQQSYSNKMIGAET